MPRAGTTAMGNMVDTGNSKLMILFLKRGREGELVNVKILKYRLSISSQ